MFIRTYILNYITIVYKVNWSNTVISNDILINSLKGIDSWISKV